MAGGEAGEQDRLPPDHRRHEEHVLRALSVTFVIEMILLQYSFTDSLHDIVELHRSSTACALLAIEKRRRDKVIVVATR